MAELLINGQCFHGGAEQFASREGHQASAMKRGESRGDEGFRRDGCFFDVLEMCRTEDKTWTIYVTTMTMAIYNENYAQITDSEVSQNCDQPLTGQATGQATGHVEQQ